MQNLVGETVGKRTFERPRRCVGDVRTDVMEVNCEGGGWRVDGHTEHHVMSNDYREESGV
jgi:hypothetical protein